MMLMMMILEEGMISHRKTATWAKKCEGERKEKGSDVVGLDQEDVLNLGGPSQKRRRSGGRELSRFAVFLVIFVFFFFVTLQPWFILRNQHLFIIFPYYFSFLFWL